MRAKTLIERLQSSDFNEQDMANALFNAVGNPNDIRQARELAAHAVGTRINMARQVLNIGISSGILVVRPHERGDPVHTRNVIQDCTTGIVYRYDPNANKQHDGTPRSRLRQWLADVDTIAAIAETEVTPTIPERMSERNILASGALKKLRKIQTINNVGFQVNSRENPDGTHTAMAYVIIDGQVREWQATSPGKESARDLACADLLVEMGWHADPPVVESVVRLRKLLKTIAKDQNAHPVVQLQRFTNKPKNNTSATIEFAPSPEDVDMRCCTITIVDRYGVGHTVIAEATNNKHAKLLAANQAMLLLRSDAIKPPEPATKMPLPEVAIAGEQSRLKKLARKVLGAIGIKF